MPKHVLVALPLSDAQRSALQASVPEYEFIFAQTETVTLAQVLEADIIMGNVPVELICQNHHLEWFQSNFAGPDTYLVPGVLPEQCLVTNATGSYGLAISEWMLGLWLGLQKDLFLYRDRQTQHKWDAITRQVRPVAGSRVLCVGMGDIGSNFAMRAHALGAEVVGVRRSVRPGGVCIRHLSDPPALGPGVPVVRSASPGLWGSPLRAGVCRDLFSAVPPLCLADRPDPGGGPVADGVSGPCHISVPCPIQWEKTKEWGPWDMTKAA